MVSADATTQENVAAVHDRLRAKVLRGELRAGEVVSQVLLARDLGVSRTPLREALRLLEREGLVVSSHNRRVRIADFSLGDLEGLYVMRIALEAIAVRVTVPRLTSRDAAELEGLLAQIDHYLRAGDFEGMAAPHSAFHARLVAGAGSRLTTTLAQLFDHADRYRRAYALADQAQVAEKSSAGHRGIVDAVIAGDAEVAVKRLVMHYLDTVTAVMAQIEPGYKSELLKTACATALQPAVNGAAAI